MQLIYLPVVDSTNSYLKQNELPLGTVVYTQNQTAGRGRMGRSWSSGGGVAVSVLVPGGCPALPLVASVAAARTLQRLLGQQMQIKWPNDILCQSAKLCGILCEGTPQKSVVGFGVNLTQAATDFAALGLPYATSAAMLGCTAPPAKEVAQALATELLALLPKGFAPLRAEYRSLSATLGQRVQILKNGQAQACTAVDVTDSGSLLVEQNGKIQEVFSGEVSVRGLYGEAIL